MKIPFTTIALSACLLATNSALANIAGPYTADSFTLHLWHVNESSVPCIDSVSSGGTNLTGLLGSAQLTNPPYSSPFTNSLNTLGTAGLAAWNTNSAASEAAGLFPTTTSTAATTMAYAGASGAFTFEALVCPLFPVLTNMGTTAHGGNNRNDQMQIICGESGVNSNRIWQFRLDPIGVNTTSPNPATGNTAPLISFINVDEGGTSYPFFATIPTNGPDAIASNQWFHVAVTYNGVPNTANNLNIYWTAMNSTNINADLILSANMPINLGAGSKPSFAIGNTGRSDNGNWLGLIDEVRISSVARGPSGMMFAPTSVSVTDPLSQFVAAGTTVTLTSVASGGGTIGLQWLYNGSNITSANGLNISSPANSTLTITNITLAQAGNYQMYATNQSSSTTSMVATVTVGAVVPGLFNTGVDNNNALAAGGSVDPHWQLVQSADLSYPGPNAIVESSTPVNYLAEGPNSEWISASDDAINASGIYEYQTSFVLDTQNPTNMQLTVNWAADDVCQDILINGVDLAITDGNGRFNFVPTVITNNFLRGSNILVCVVSNNSTSPTGFRAELSALAAPQPSTAVLVLNGPSNAVAAQYQNATFAVTAFGSGPLSYQWFFGTNLLSGQTSRTLVLTDLDPSQAGTYSVHIVNSLSTNSSSATLTVTTPDTLEWRGTNSADWDTTTTNWHDTTASADAAFSQNLNVLFDNNGSGQPVVSLDLPLTPNSVVVGANNTYTFGGGGYLTGNFNLTVNGPGTLILDTPNTYSGNTIIQGGTLQVGNNDANGSVGSSTVSNNAALVFIRTDTVLVPNQISGTGTLTMAGSGNLLLTGNNTNFTGAISAANGILTPRSSTAFGTGSAITTVPDGGQVYIDQNINLPTPTLVLGGFGGNGMGALHKGGAGATTIGGPIALSDSAGILVDASSTLILTNPAAITSTNVNLAIQCLNSADCTIHGAVNLGSGSFTEYGPVSGTGTIILTSVSNNWTGGTTINTDSILQVGDGGPDGSIGSGPIDIESTLTVTSASTIVIPVAITGAGTLNVNGSGRLTLTSANAFGGTALDIGAAKLQLGNGASLVNGTLAIGNHQTDTSSLELAGNNTVSLPITIFPRAFGTLGNPAHIDNVGGTNTVNQSSPISIPTGGNDFIIESASGYLIFNSGVTPGGAGRIFAMQGASSGEVDGPITQSSGNSVNVYMLGSGTWSLNSAGSSYTGTTIVSNGTLLVNGTILRSPVSVNGGTFGGVGTLSGTVVVNAGGTLAPTLASGPSTPIGTLTINNNLTLQPGSATAMQINPSPGASDQIVGMTNVTFGGSLTVVNLGGALAAGNAFPLFNAGNYSGRFTSVSPATPGSGLRWNLAGMTVGGYLRVTTTNISRPTITSTTLSGGNLVLSGSGGSLGDTYLVLTSTNVGAPLTNWTQVANGAFDGTGHFEITNTVSTNVPHSFFVVEAQ